MRTLAVGLLGLSVVACSSGGPPPPPPGGATVAATPVPGRRTSDPRVRSFLGRPPPELSSDARWLNAAPSSLAAMKGRVVFVQFAFPT
jgi:hypothetical protein